MRSARGGKLAKELDDVSLSGKHNKNPFQKQVMEI